MGASIALRSDAHQRPSPSRGLFAIAALGAVSLAAVIGVARFAGSPTADRAGGWLMAALLAWSLASAAVVAVRLRPWAVLTTGAALVVVAWRFGLGSDQPAVVAALLLAGGVGLLLLMLLVIGSSALVGRRWPLAVLLVPFTTMAAGCLTMLVGAYAQVALPPLPTCPMLPLDEIGYLRMTD